MNWQEFTPRFSHLVIMLVSVAVFAAGGTLLAEYVYLSAVMYVCALFAAFVAWNWTRMLLAEAESKRMVSEQDAERANMQTVIEFTRVLGDKLPPAALLAAIAHAFPALELDQVQLPDEAAQVKATPDGWNMRRGIPWGLATADQYRTLATGYFDQATGMPIRYWTETQIGKSEPVFSRKQFETILSELVTSGLATKSAGGEVMLTESGEAWLTSYYSPTPAGYSPTHR